MTGHLKDEPEPARPHQEQVEATALQTTRQGAEAPPPAGAFVSGDVALLRRNRGVLAAGFAPLAAGVLLVLFAAFGQPLDARVTAGLWGAFFSFVGL